MKKTFASWSIEINLDCPYKSCDAYLNLMDSNLFPQLHDGASPIGTFEPGINYGQSDREIKYFDRIICPECKREIKLEGIQW